MLGTISRDTVLARLQAVEAHVTRVAGELSTDELAEHAPALYDVYHRTIEARAAVYVAGSSITETIEREVAALERAAWWSTPVHARLPMKLTRQRAAFLGGGVIFLAAVGTYFWRTR